jgi:hypothetical protein
MGGVLANREVVEQGEQAGKTPRKGAMTPIVKKRPEQNY